MKDIKIQIENLMVGGKHILSNSEFIISSQKKYGLIGKNGIGKTTIVNHIFTKKDLDNITKYITSQDLIIDDDITVFDFTLKSNNKLYELHKQLEMISEDSEEYYNLSDKLDELDYDKEKSKIHKILHGLGFNHNQHDECAINFYGGWRMRISLARALYLNPELLILDEPTNHLDLEGNIWLCDYLKKYKNTIILISHDIEFLDDVCTDIIHLENQKLKYYKGGYYLFKKQYEKDMVSNQKLYEETEKRINAYKKSGKTKNEIEAFLKLNPLPFISYERPIRIDFGEIPDDMKNLIMINNVSFYYDKNIKILENINFSVDASRHIALVGRNGGGKSTMMKLMIQEIKPVSGEVITDRQIRFGYYNQHYIENLPLEMNVIDYLRDKFNQFKEQEIREYLGKIGLKSNEHILQFKNLSGGQKIRVALVELQMMKPHVLLLDEPTNHLDIDTIEALKKAINKFNGGVIMITHNIDLITDTDCEVWKIPECNKIDYDEYIEEIIDIK